MKKLIILFIIALSLAACSSHGNLNVINRTNHFLYFKISDIDRTVDPHQTVTVSMYAGKKFIFNPGEKTYTIYLEGETFVMHDGNTPTTTTKITIQSNKPTDIYADPNSAGIKIINNSDKIVHDVAYQKIYPDSVYNSVILTQEIDPGSKWFKQVPYSCDTDSFNIRFSYTKTENDTIFTNTMNLQLDQQFLLEIR